MTVPQRKGHIKSSNLCWNCLRPGHNTADCRSDYRCRVCDGKLVHHNKPDTPTQPPTAAVSTAASQPTAHVPSSLLMTSQVLLKGPTGRTLVARALLDSGATFTLISTKAMKTLGLHKSNTCITIKGVQNRDSNPSHSLTNFTLSPVQEPDKAFHISAAVVPEVTCDLPLQGATSVKELPHIKELSLTDPQFHSPGRIDHVLGENILDKLLLPREVRTGPEGTPSAWRTVFGWAIRGQYTPDNAGPTGQAAVHLAITRAQVMLSPSSGRWKNLLSSNPLSQLKNSMYSNTMLNLTLLFPLQASTRSHFQGSPRHLHLERVAAKPCKGSSPMNALCCTKGPGRSFRPWYRSTWT